MEMLVVREVGRLEEPLEVHVEVDATVTVAMAVEQGGLVGLWAVLVALVEEGMAK